MRSFLVLVAGAGVLLASSAFAGPMTNGIHGVNTGVATEQVRMVCDEYGRCFNARGSRRAYVDRDAYAYEPRPRYYQQHQYQQQRRHYNDGPGIGIQVPGVSIGVGGGGRW